MSGKWLVPYRVYTPPGRVYILRSTIYIYSGVLEFNSTCPFLLIGAVIESILRVYIYIFINSDYLYLCDNV